MAVAVPDVTLTRFISRFLRLRQSTQNFSTSSPIVYGRRYLRAAAPDYLDLSDGRRKLDQVSAVPPTWAEHRIFTSELRAQLKGRGLLGSGERVMVHEPQKWTGAQTRARGTTRSEWSPLSTGLRMGSKPATLLR